ncbi:hypothetical protein ACO0LG_14800 [Undibacterium sp. Ji42W]|uniref:hypothetical protein n=1 Tax=Undibacterium sp. Ji42W TaxID=3413039 RepID=UPI003BF24943
MVSSLATESALAALSDVGKIISNNGGMPDPLVYSGLAYATDMLRVAGFVAPTVFAKEIQHTFSQAILGTREVRAFKRAMTILSSYLKDAIRFGAGPTLYFYEEVLLLSDVSGRLPPACGNFFAPFVFWDIEDDLYKSVQSLSHGLSREAYQAALLAFLRNKDVAGLKAFAQLFVKVAEANENTCSYSMCRTMAAFFAVITSSDAFLNQDEMQLFSIVDGVFFKQSDTGHLPEPAFISRLLHVIAKSTADTSMVRETQTYFKLEGLLYGAALGRRESIRA